MALPSSGAISLNNVNQELGRVSPYNQTISLNDSVTRTLFGIASGQISMLNGYGKSNEVFGNKGYAMGGAGGGEYDILVRAEIDGIQFDTEAAINPSAVLSLARAGCTGVNSATRGYAVGGNIDATTEIDGIRFDTEAAINPSAVLSLARGGGAGVNSATRGYAMGGSVSLPSAANYTEIDGIQFDTEAAINPSAVLSVARAGCTGVNSATRGYAMSGANNTVYTAEIDGIQFDTEAAINPSAALSVARYGSTGVNSATRGYAMGGSNGANVAKIDGIQFDTEAAINPSAVLSVGVVTSAAVNSATRGYAMGGRIYTGPGRTASTTEIVGFQFDTEAAINPSAALSVARGDSAGVQMGRR